MAAHGDGSGVTAAVKQGNAGGGGSGAAAVVAAAVAAVVAAAGYRLCAARLVEL